MSMTPATRKAALWIAAVFLFGVALGGVLGYAFTRHRTALAAEGRTEQVRRAQMVERLDGELHLTAAQRQTLDQIMTGLQGQYKTIHEQIDPQINNARQKARSEIRTILTPEQKPKFEDFLKRLDEERKRNGER